MSAARESGSGDLSHPRHIAIIMDGNGRWASGRGLPRSAGHRQGIENARKIAEGAAACGIKYLTLFAFSSENWNRPRQEVQGLMALFELFLRREVTRLQQHGIRVRIIGRRSRFPARLRAAAENMEADTRHCTRLNLQLAISYGGRDEIVSATRALVADAAEGKLRSESVSEDMLAAHMETARLPEPDLLIRTGGEQRISNFLLWQLAYTELYFSKTYWPDFGVCELELAIGEYRSRTRRFGGLPEPVFFAE